MIYFKEKNMFEMSITSITNLILFQNELDLPVQIKEVSIGKCEYKCKCYIDGIRNRCTLPYLILLVLLFWTTLTHLIKYIVLFWKMSAIYDIWQLNSFHSSYLNTQTLIYRTHLINTDMFLPKAPIHLFFFRREVSKKIIMVWILVSFMFIISV